ncbi:MerR family transcriptional regulator [Nocardioides sp.]|uniref:MerR family transcriptional regulator n=1 Tax=Nocardioides sp. TaxID=35761 RepID=UPI002C3EEBA3|nr:MerR family transcriptional regulator [Nocardioides sp.]HXH77456.1 MerR family transcriptional regulator [Nocardioides sp.]
MTEPRTLLTIGDFARAAGLTPKALRLYDDLGLLPPAEVDPSSGYRRYDPSQLERARLVATLRLLGMPLARIQQVLDHSPAAAAREVETFWCQVEADTATRRGIVTTLVHQLRNEAHIMTTSTDTLRTEFGVSHRQGGRERQQDALVATPELVAVADGFGDRDDVAAAALAAFATGGLDGAIREIAPEVSTALPDQPSFGTTLTAVRIEGSAARITHIGDARVWLVRDREFRQVTHDHTVVAALLETGQLTADEARSHQHRNLLNRALTPGVVADECVVDLRAGDRLVLTTDGVHSFVDDLGPLLTSTAGPQDVADAVATAVALAGEPDNHTVVVVDLS